MEGTRYISELLEQHDCVIIPGLGGFVGSYHPAGIHPIYHTFQPPYKKLLFNVSLRQNDGLLADHIARAEHIPFSEANEKVRKYAEDCQLRLKMNRQVLIRDVGRLYMGQEGTVQFDQDLRHNLLADSFGLQPFFSVPVKKQVQEAALVPAAEPVITHRLARRAISGPLKWAAMLALPVGLAILLSISGYDHFKSSGLTYADVLSSISIRLSPFSSAEKKADPIPLKKATAHTPPATSPLPPAPSTLRTAPSPQPAATTPSVPVALTDRPFAVIIGAFRVEENASKLVAKLQSEGVSASLYDVTPGGLHRVASGTFADRGEAIAALHQVRAKGFDGAWLLVK